MRRFQFVYFDKTDFKQREIEEKEGLPFTTDGSVKMMKRVVKGGDEAQARRVFALLVDREKIIIDPNFKVTEII